MKTKSRKVKVVKERQVHTYAELWHASDCVLKAGIANPVGSSWQFLSSIILTAFAFEAYMNHVGSQIFSCWEGLERLAPIAKFELISESLKVEFTEGKNKRPLNTIGMLFAFRKEIAHGRSQNLKPDPILRDVNENLDSYLGQRPLTFWEQQIKDNEFAKLAREDVQTVLQKLNDARPEPKEHLFMLGSSFHSASLVEE